MTAIEYMKWAAKAIFAGVVTFLGSVSVLLVGDTTFGTITQGQWVTIALATIVAVGGVFGLTNGEKPA